jgi:hypothetical protein
MAHAYTPGLRVSPHTVIRKTRRLPLAGDVLVAPGKAVKPDTVVARTFLPGYVHNINVANALGIPPEDVPGVMIRQVGNVVSVDEEIARSRGLFGFFKSSARSPVSGTIELISDVTGQALVREPPIPVEVTAYIEGHVMEVLPREGVVLETTGVFIQGIFGIGGEVYAPLYLVADDPEEILTPDRIDASCAGRIVCGGAMTPLETLKKLIEVRACGVVTGGVSYHDIGELLGYQIGVAVTGGEDIGLTVIATEGFGRMRMAERTLALLRRHDGQPASISGATQIRAGVIRPEVIIPSEAPDQDGGTGSDISQGLRPGAQVRIIRNPFFGQLGLVEDLPEQPGRLPTEATVRILRVRLPAGEVVTVPRANVEIVEV